MKQHYCGTDIGFPLEAFQYLQVEHEQAEQRTILLSVDAQIVSNELLCGLSYGYYFLGADAPNSLMNCVRICCTAFVYTHGYIL